MSEYVPKPKPFEKIEKVELDLSNYATKTDLKNAATVETSKFAKTFDLASLKSEINKLVIGKLESTPVDLSKLSHIVKNEVIKEDMHDELVKRVNAIHIIDTSYLVKKS